jgi:hypothetical protein
MGALLPYRFDFDSTNRIARCRLAGRIDAAEVKQCYREAVDFFTVTDPLSGIFDLSDVISFDFPSETVYELTKFSPIMPDQSRVRVAIAPSPAAFGLARMFEMLGDKTRPNLHVVRTAPEAWAILGVSEPQFRAWRA